MPNESSHLSIKDMIANPNLFKHVQEEDIEEITDGIYPLLINKVEAVSNFVLHKTAYSYKDIEVSNKSIKGITI